MPFNDQLSNLQAHRAAHPQSDNMLHTGMLKGFMDGSLGSRTAALIEPYADDPEQFRPAAIRAGQAHQMTKERVNAGFQIGFHAIGDKGVQMALDAFADRRKKDGARRSGAKAANRRQPTSACASSTRKSRIRCRWRSSKS